MLRYARRIILEVGQRPPSMIAGHAPPSSIMPMPPVARPRITTQSVMALLPPGLYYAFRRNQPFILRPSRMLRPSSVMFAAPAASSSA